MDKRELVELTIERLLANFEKNPDSFELKLPGSGSYGGPSVIWRPKVNLGSYDSLLVDDPNNNSAVIISINPSSNEITCYLFMRAPHSFEAAKADYTVASCETFQRLRSHWRKLQKLISLIKDRDLRRENLEYLAKLSSVFPDTLDKHILKD